MESQMKLKKVIVSKMVAHPVEGGPGRQVVQYVLEPAGEALFHGFGVSYEEFENGPGNYTTAIVEWPDGSVENIPVQHIKFVVPHTLPAQPPKGAGELRNEVLLAKSTDFNPFTLALKAECQTNGKVFVQQRNGMWLEVEFVPGGSADGSEDDRFVSLDGCRRWECNGASITSRDFDLIEFRPVGALGQGGS